MQMMLFAQSNSIFIQLLFKPQYKSMQDQQEQQQEFEVYFQGSCNELYSFLYPLAGPKAAVFDSLTLKELNFIPKHQEKYKDIPEEFLEKYVLEGQFENIDGIQNYAKSQLGQNNQKIENIENNQNTNNTCNEIHYTSNIVERSSNHYYSIMIPDKRVLIWRSIFNFVEMRPTIKKNQHPKPSNQEAKSKKTQKIIENEGEQKKVLKVIQSNSANNIVMQSMRQAPFAARIEANMETTLEQYMKRLCKQN